MKTQGKTQQHVIIMQSRFTNKNGLPAIPLLSGINWCVNGLSNLEESFSDLEKLKASETNYISLLDPPAKQVVKNYNI